MTAYQLFPNTHWSLVRRAGLPADDARREALHTLLERYLPALRAYLQTVRQLPEEEADDLLQAFIASRILERQLIGQADPTKGRFRNLLLISLRNFAVSRRRSERLRRTDDLNERMPDPGVLTGEKVAQVKWARTLLDGVIEAMRRECESLERPDIWEVFQDRILAPLYQSRPSVGYEELARRHRMNSPMAAANLLVTAKRMFARLLRDAVAEYEMEPDAIADEIRELWQILAESGKIRQESLAG